jgi:hypothetical protein
VLDPEDDEDGDGLSNDEEGARGTHPFLADTDGGGTGDGDEVALGLDPLDPADDSGSGPRPFIRGDADGSGKLNITDPIRVLRYLFGGGDAPASFDAGDANDDGKLNIADAIFLLSHLFLGGRPPPPPFPAPGLDPTADDLR